MSDQFFDFGTASNAELFDVLNVIASSNTSLADYMAVVARYVRPGALGIDWADRYAFTSLSSGIILELQGLFSAALAQEYKARALLGDNDENSR